MQFRVTRLRLKGVRLPSKSWSNAPSVVGELSTYSIQDDLTAEWVNKAVVHESSRALEPMIPELIHVELAYIANQAMVLKGYERQEGRRGIVEFRQEWWVRPSWNAAEEIAKAALRQSG
jgi:hypothetical protein